MGSGADGRERLWKSWSHRNFYFLGPNSVLYMSKMPYVIDHVRRLKFGAIRQCARGHLCGRWWSKEPTLFKKKLLKDN